MTQLNCRSFSMQKVGFVFALLLPLCFASSVQAQPIAIDDAVQAVSEVATELLVLPNDVATTHEIVPSTLQIIEEPTNGELMVDAFSGTVIYESNVGFEGFDSFSYRVQDSASNWSNEADVTVEVTENLPPFIVTFDYEVDMFGFYLFSGLVIDEELQTLEFSFGGVLNEYSESESQVTVDGQGEYEFAIYDTVDEGTATIQAIDSLGQASNIVSTEVQH